jgi:hypothetical protein
MHFRCFGIFIIFYLHDKVPINGNVSRGCQIHGGRGPLIFSLELRGGPLIFFLEFRGGPLFFSLEIRGVKGFFSPTRSKMCFNDSKI